MTPVQRLKFLDIAQEFLSPELALDLLDRVEASDLSFTSGAHAIEDGLKMAEMRKARRITQADLAEKLNCHWVTVSKLENNKIGMTRDWRERIFAALCTDAIPT